MWIWALPLGCADDGRPLLCCCPALVSSGMSSTWLAQGSGQGVHESSGGVRQEGRVRRRRPFPGAGPWRRGDNMQQQTTSVTTGPALAISSARADTREAGVRGGAPLRVRGRFAVLVVAAWSMTSCEAAAQEGDDQSKASSSLTHRSPYLMSTVSTRPPSSDAMTGLVDQGAD